MGENRYLLPREHGAYAELAFPLATGLLLASPSPWAVSLALAAVAFFWAHEPLAILLGTRGQRIRDRRGDRARRLGWILPGSGAALGAIGWAGAGGTVWPTILLPSLAGLGIVSLALRGSQKTLLGEILVVTAFSTLLLPLAAASGAEMGRALAASVVWWVSFSLGTVEVHAIKARHKGQANGGWSRTVSPLASGIVTVVASAVVLGDIGTGGFHPALAETGESAPGLVGILKGPGAGVLLRELPRAALALLPPAAGVFLMALVRPHPRHLKRVGWTLVGANSLALVILLAR